MQSLKLFFVLGLALLSNSFLKGFDDDKFDKDVFIKAREFQKTVSVSIARVMNVMDNIPDRLVLVFEGQRELSQSLADIFDKISTEFDKNPNEMPSDTELVVNVLNKVNDHYRDFAASIKNDLLDLKAAFKAQKKDVPASEIVANQPSVESGEKAQLPKTLESEQSKVVSAQNSQSTKPVQTIDKEKILQARARLRKELAQAQSTKVLAN